MRNKLILMMTGLVCFGGVSFLFINEPASSDTVTVSDKLTHLNATIHFHEQKCKADLFSFIDFRLLGEAFDERGRLSGELSDLRSAEQAFQKSVEIQVTRNESAIVGLANAMQSQHRFRAADSVLFHSWSMIQHLPVAMAVRGDVQFELGNYNSADSLYSQYAQLQPGLSAWSRQAKMATHRGNWQLAREMWEKICALPAEKNESDLAWAWVMHGDLYLRAGLNEKARDCFEHAKLILPGYSLALEHLAETYEIEGKYTRAIPLLDAAIQASNHADLLFRRADLALCEGDAGLAGELRKSAINQLEAELASENTGHRRVLIDILLEDAEQAPRALELARNEYAERRDIGAEITLARALSANGFHKEAAVHARAAVQYRSYEPELFRHASLILRIAGEDSFADSLAAIAQTMNPLVDKNGV